MKQVLISIIIPVYNCELYIKRCIESVINQVDLKDKIELILIDDGSTDQSGKICKRYADEFKNVIKFCSIKNSGVSDARNKGLSFAKGKYVTFLDSDDYVEDGYIKEIKRLIEKFPTVQLFNFGFYSVVENKKMSVLSRDVINYKDFLYCNKEVIKNDFVNLWDSTMLYNIWNKVYLNSIIKDNKIKFLSGVKFGEDVEFNKSYLDKIDSLYNSKQCFYNYIREREGAATKKYQKDFFKTRKKEFFEFNQYFEKWGIDKSLYYEFSCRRYVERILGCMENIYCSDMKFKEKYNEVRAMIFDDITRETLKYVKPKSKKISILLMPIKFKMTLFSMIMGKFFNIIKTRFPSLFNKLKNRR